MSVPCACPRGIEPCRAGRSGGRGLAAAPERGGAAGAERGQCGALRSVSSAGAAGAALRSLPAAEPGCDWRRAGGHSCPAAFGRSGQRVSRRRGGGRGDSGSGAGQRDVPEPLSRLCPQN